MSVSAETTLGRWGNSNAFRLTREVCESMGIGVGSSAHVEADPVARTITLTFPNEERRYHRSGKRTLEELCADWDGEKVGEEWSGPDVGTEEVA